MAISSCNQCGKGFRSVSIDDTGTLAICDDGHYNFDPTTASRGDAVNIGNVKVTGQCAIGNGATAIGRKKGRK